MFSIKRDKKNTPELPQLNRAGRRAMEAITRKSKRRGSNFTKPKKRRK